MKRANRSFRVVRCPICKKLIKTTGKIFFRHCGFAFLIRDHIEQFDASIYSEKEGNAFLESENNLKLKIIKGENNASQE